jgi:hypothetical protein
MTNLLLILLVTGAPGALKTNQIAQVDVSRLEITTTNETDRPGAIPWPSITELQKLPSVKSDIFIVSPDGDKFGNTNWLLRQRVTNGTNVWLEWASLRSIRGRQ